MGSKCCLHEQENTDQKDSALAQEIECYREGKSFREVLWWYRKLFCLII